jgi:hypothetical protein
VLSPINDRDQHNYEVLRQHSILNLSEVKELTYNHKLEYLKGLGITFKDTKLDSNQMEKLVDLLCKYKHIFAESFTQLPGSDLIEHEIKVTSERPIRQRHYCLASFLEKELQRQCDEPEKCGIIEKSDSPWSSPTFLVKKPDNTCRKIIGSQILLTARRSMYLSLPSKENFMDLVGQENPSFFSLLDQKNGFWSLKVHPNSRKYLGFSTSKFHYTYTQDSQ